jgi:hypothetical protein
MWYQILKLHNIKFNENLLTVCLFLCSGGHDDYHGHILATLYWERTKNINKCSQQMLRYLPRSMETKPICC